MSLRLLLILCGVHSLLTVRSMLLASIQWMSPSKTGKAGIVPLACDPLCATLNSEGSQIGIRDEVTLGVGLVA